VEITVGNKLKEEVAVTTGGSSGIGLGRHALFVVFVTGMPHPEYRR
jgi:predicted RNA-binding protein with TRAM domain